MNEKYTTYFTHDKSSRAVARKSAIKTLVAAGHSRAVAIKRAKVMVK